MRVGRLGLALAVAATLQLAPARISAADEPPLAGIVASREEGPMEGVVVTLKKAGATMSLSVVSDAQGRYEFPARRLEPGRYTISTRAVGYDLNGPIAAQITADKPTVLDIKLGLARDVSRQLSDAEWIMSVPATDAQRAGLLNCIACHSLDVVMRSTEDAIEFAPAIARMMSYSKGSIPIHPQLRKDSIWGDNADRFQAQADFLAAINLAKTPYWDYKLNKLPRPTGRGTRVVITQYDMPRRTIEPHDVVLAGGYAWFSNFGEQSLGRLDPATGEVREFAMSVFKKGWPTGALDLEADRQGNLWLGMMYQAAVARFDPRREQFDYWRLPPDLDSDTAELRMLTIDRDGKLWTNDAGPQNVYRLDPGSGSYLSFDPLRALPGGKRDHRIYDVAADSSNNLFMTDFLENYLIRLDGETGEATTYRTPTPDAHNRRGHRDAQERFFFAEYLGNKLAMLDTRSGEIKEWSLPTKWSAPYAAVSDRNGDLWAASMTTDRIVRIDSKTGAAAEYPMPRPTSMRRIFVDESSDRVSLWVGSTHGASILHIEPLD